MKIGYSKEFDADYNMENGEWLDDVCNDLYCCYCVGRPRVATINEADEIDE